MAEPKFETNIEDVYTIIDNNTVGAKERGNVQETGPSYYELRRFNSSIATVKELIEYGKNNSIRILTLGFDGESSENNLKLPAGMTLQVKDGKQFKIIINDFVPARCNGRDVVSSVNSGANKDKFPHRFSPVVVNRNIRYYINDNGEWIEESRPIMHKKQYFAIDSYKYAVGTLFGEYALLNDNGAIKIAFNDTVYPKRLHNIDIRHPRIKHVCDHEMGNFVYMKSSKTSQIELFSTKDQNQTTIKVKDYNDNFVHLDGFYSLPSKQELSIKMLVYQNSGTTYLYSHHFVLDSNYLKKVINEVLITHVNVSPNRRFCQYFGGQSIYSYNGNEDYNFVFEQSIPFIPDYARFIEAGRYLYYFASDTQKSRIVIYKKDTDRPNSPWELLKDQRGKSYIYLTHTYDIANKVLRIVFKDIKTDLVYYFINKSISLGKNSSLIGFEIENNAVFFRSGNNAKGETLHDIGIIDSFTPHKVSYCSINAKHTPVHTGADQRLNNCIVKSNTDAVHHNNLVDNVPVNTFLYNNLILSNETAVHIEEKGLNKLLYNNFVIKNNTIKATNGILVTNTPARFSNIFKNNIIDAYLYAIGFTGVASPLTVKNSVINGKVSKFVEADSTNILNVDPLYTNEQSENYKLMSIAMGYPKDSKAIGIGDDGKDAGAYDVSRLNNGELNKKTFDLTGYIIDIGMEWHYPKKETSFDHRGNFIKYMGERTRVIELLKNGGLVKYSKVGELESLINEVNTIRFFPYGNDGMPFIIEVIEGMKETKNIDSIDETKKTKVASKILKTEITKQTDGIAKTKDTKRYGHIYKRSALLTYNNVDMTATVTNGHKFIPGYLKGGWIIQYDQSNNDYDNTKNAYYIRDNDTYRLYLEHKDGDHLPRNGNFVSKMLWFYVKTSDHIEYLNRGWHSKDQFGKLPSVKLYVTESKEV